MGDREGAAIALGVVRDLASEVAITPLLIEIENLARRGRLSLIAAVGRPRQVAPEAPPDPWGLTACEREVLDLLAVGRTSRQIGDALFISGMTASVHVTHTLAKLGVTSRTETALLAGRHGTHHDSGPVTP